MINALKENSTKLSKSKNVQSCHYNALQYLQATILKNKVEEDRQKMCHVVDKSVM